MGLVRLQHHNVEVVIVRIKKLIFLPSEFCIPQEKAFISAEHEHGECDKTMGTTIFAFCFSLVRGKRKVPAVIVGSDGRMSGGKIWSDAVKKVYELDEYTVVGGSGSMPDAREVIRGFEMVVQHYNSNVDRKSQELDLRGKIRILERITRARFLEEFHFRRHVGFLVAGYDSKESRCSIFEVAGGVTIPRKSELFGGVGSGYTYAEVSLMEKAGGEYTKDEVIALVRGILKHVSAVDNFSGGLLRAHLITSKGVEEVVFNEEKT
ncbi:MAG: hypothetical protein HZA35_02210 [Parcubacteria group bacterium]|nr:hypothetical protein [Parcubacteria group bacterium]